MKTLHKEVRLARKPEDVWTALTDPEALAAWLMPNDFRPEVGHVFRFHVDPMPGFSGINECRVLEVEPPRRLSYTWVPVPKKPVDTPPPPMTVTWTLEPDGDGTRLILDQSGLEVLNWWWRTSMAMGWGRMMNKLLPRALERIEGGRYAPGPRLHRDFGIRTVPEGYAK